MVDSGLLAEGSVRGFLSGSHFNRCKRLHPVGALSLKVLHFKAFLKVYQKDLNGDDLHLNEIIEILEADRSDHKTFDVTLPALADILERYNLFAEETLSGKHGRTAQFALKYVGLVELYQLLERAVRTSDVKLYNYAAHEICALCFAFNHQNYARWLTRNHDNFANIEKTHPGLLDDFENGALSIRRTAKNFCRSPVDLTLEQTINANAGNKLTGVTSFTNNLQARQRWSETHSARTAIISNFLEFLHIEKFNETSESPYQSKIFSRLVKKFMEQVLANINPFDDDINPSELFNLSSGKAASSETAEFLLNVSSIGVEQRDEFIGQCAVDSLRFDKPIKRNAVKSFASENAVCKKSAAKNFTDANVERNVLGHVLCFATQTKQKVDLMRLFSYPLTSVPHSLASFDGTMISNCRNSELTSLLMARIEGTLSPSQDFEVQIIDGFYLLSTLRDSPMRYGQFADFLLKRLCDTRAFEVHVIFDKDETTSIKDIDIRKKMREIPMQYKIHGPNQERTGALSKCLTNVSFRDELINFLINYWACNEDIVMTLGDKRVFMSYGQQCYLYSKDFGRKKNVTSLENNHIELETKCILHLEKIGAKNILIKIASTDTIMVYLLYFMQFWSTQREIWIETGDVQRNTLQLINVTKIFEELSPAFINALPAWYIFTGCSYEPSFHGKGRKSCLKILEKNVPYQIAFGNIGIDLSSSENGNEMLEQYTCELYHVNLKTVNEARVRMFENTYSADSLKDISKNGTIFFSFRFNSNPI